MTGERSERGGGGGSGWSGGDDELILRCCSRRPCVPCDIPSVLRRRYETITPIPIRYRRRRARIPTSIPRTNNNTPILTTTIIDRRIPSIRRLSLYGRRRLGSGLLNDGGARSDRYWIRGLDESGRWSRCGSRSRSRLDWYGRWSGCRSWNRRRLSDDGSRRSTIPNSENADVRPAQ